MQIQNRHCQVDNCQKRHHTLLHSEEMLVPNSPDQVDSNNNNIIEKEILSETYMQFFFSIWDLFHEHSRITGLQGKGEGIPLTPHYHFHPLPRHLHISGTITAGSSPLHIVSSRTRTGNLWFPSASR